MAGRNSLCRKLQGGFSLIEVLVALAVFGIGLGGLSVMLLTAIQGTAEARNQTAAALMGNNLAELIVMNPAYLGHYLLAEGGGTECATMEACTGADFAADSLQRWQSELERSLAGASGAVCRDTSPGDGRSGDPQCDGAGLAVVKVFWHEPHHAGDERQGQRRVVLPVMD